jgi:hypothetical protein
MNLFYKDRDIPYKLKAEEALMRRLNVNHPKLAIIEEEYRKKRAGIRGEKELDYHLSCLTNNYLIINDLRLQQGAHFFQIDSLLIFPKVSFLPEQLFLTMNSISAYGSLTKKKKASAIPSPRYKDISDYYHSGLMNINCLH